MTKLKGVTPNPAQAAAAYRETFQSAVVDAGGKDGRITKAAAQKLAERGDAGKLVADNILDHLEKTGKKSVGVNVFLNAMTATVETEVAAVAGANQKMSLLELRNLPANLVPDMLHLRGKDDLASPSSGPALSRVVFEEGALYEFMFYADPPWKPAETLATGAIGFDGNFPVLSGLSGMPAEYAPIVDEVLKRMWETSFQHRYFGPSDLPFKIPDEGTVKLGPIIDETTGKEGLLVQWDDLDDASFAWFYEKKPDGTFAKLHEVFLN